MAWESRERGGSYYYTKERVGSRVRSRYVGSGMAATLAEAYDKRDRAKKDKERAALRREIAKQDAIDARIDNVCRMVDSLVQAALIAAGFHQHKRQWRRKRR